MTFLIIGGNLDALTAERQRRHGVTPGHENRVPGLQPHADALQAHFGQPPRRAQAGKPAGTGLPRSTGRAGQASARR